MARNDLDPHGSFARATLGEQLANLPVPPYPLNDDEQVVWDMIVRTRAPVEWSGLDEFFAADLCRVTIALRDARAQLADGDSVITGPRGGGIMNPLVSVVSSLLGQVLRLSGRL